jgi:VIT1/CCC1 family predicted Fe2+/Mn2+ transporter
LDFGVTHYWSGLALWNAPAVKEKLRSDRIAWLGAAELGANDGILTASLALGVAAADGTHSSTLVAGVAGLVARSDVDGRRRIRFGALAGRS